MPTIGYAGRVLGAGEVIRDVSISGGTPDDALPGADAPKLWCIGLIVYEDGNRRRRETGFCRSFDVVGDRWVKEPESDYEYAY